MILYSVVTDFSVLVIDIFVFTDINFSHFKITMIVSRKYFLLYF